MTVRCPRCETLYRRPARPETDTTTSFRCVRCGHVFEAGAAEPADGATAMEMEDSGDVFTDTDDDAEQFVFDDSEEEPDDDATPPPAQEPARSVSTPPRFAVRMLLIVTFGYAVLSAYLYTHVEATHRLMGEVPVIGPRLVERRLNPTVVQLVGLKGEYLRVKGDRLVFAVAGTAVNGAAVPVKGLRVEGWISGAAEQRQAVSCGARPRQIATLSVPEIGLLQRLEPPSTWALAPGDTVDFLVVFAEPPTDLREFGARVASVRAAGRAMH